MPNLAEFFDKRRGPPKYFPAKIKDPKQGQVSGRSQGRAGNRDKGQAGVEENGNPLMESTGFLFAQSSLRAAPCDDSEDAPDAPQMTCAQVLAEVTRSRGAVEAAESAHTRKALMLQLEQLEMVCNVVQKGESLVLDGEKLRLQADLRRLLARARGIAAAARKDTTTVQPRSWSPVGNYDVDDEESASPVAADSSSHSVTPSPDPARSVAPCPKPSTPAERRAAAAAASASKRQAEEKRKAAKEFLLEGARLARLERAEQQAERQQKDAHAPFKADRDAVSSERVNEAKDALSLLSQRLEKVAVLDDEARNALSLLASRLGGEVAPRKSGLEGEEEVGMMNHRVVAAEEELRRKTESFLGEMERAVLPMPLHGTLTTTLTRVLESLHTARSSQTVVLSGADAQEEASGRGVQEEEHAEGEGGAGATQESGRGSSLCCAGEKPMSATGIKTEEDVFYQALMELDEHVSRLRAWTRAIQEKKDREVAGKEAGSEVEQLMMVVEAAKADADALPARRKTMLTALRNSRVVTRGTRTQPYRSADGTWVRPVVAARSSSSQSSLGSAT